MKRRTLQVSHGFPYQIGHDELTLHKDCARCVRTEFTAEHKNKCLEVSQSLIDF